AGPPSVPPPLELELSALEQVRRGNSYRSNYFQRVRINRRAAAALLNRSRIPDRKYRRRPCQNLRLRFAPAAPRFGWRYGFVSAPYPFAIPEPRMYLI